MDKPEEKSGPQGPLRPPHPPPGGKKMSGVPKGPVPPRGPGALPGMTPMGQSPSAPRPQAPIPSVPRTPSAPPPVGSRPPMPGLPMSGMPMQAQKPPLTPSLPPPVIGGPVPPALNQRLAETESSKNDMEQKIGDLEKRLSEEKEKVLLASLRSKEEEAISAKVENSIKDIQDKLRREKREQELDENRRKAEARAAEMERRMGEEREAWVSTLKTQLNQRDQVTQEMEGHFSTRLKDLEYRWAQEKTALENALREREADVIRIRQESALKSEQEKSFWEDRFRSATAERDKLDRDLERLKDKLQQEKENFMAERQLFREQAAKAEGSLKLVEDHYRIEKSALAKEMEAAVTVARQQQIIEKDSYEKQLASLQSQLNNQIQEAAKRTGVEKDYYERQITLLQQQVSNAAKEMADKMLISNSLVEQLNELRHKHSNEESRLVETREKLGAALQKETELEAKVSSYENSIKADREKLNLLETRLSVLAPQLEDYKRRVGELDANSDVNRKKVEIELEESRKKYEKVINELNELRHKHQMEESRLVETRGKLGAALQKETELEAKVSSYEKSIKADREKLILLETQLAVLTPQLEDYKRRVSELDANSDVNRKKVEIELDESRKKYEKVINELTVEIEKSKRNAKEEVALATQQADGRIRTLQTRLDYYDSNIKREYENAKALVQEEVLRINSALKDSEQTTTELKAVVDQQEKLLATDKEKIESLVNERISHLQEMDHMKNDWKQAQWDFESQIKDLNDQVKAQKYRVEQAEEIRITLEQELKQRGASHSFTSEQLAEREAEVKDLNEEIEKLKKDLIFSKEKVALADNQVEDYRKIISGKGMRSNEEWQAVVREKEAEVERFRSQAQKLSAVSSDAEKNQEMFYEKEKVLKQMLADKENMLEGQKVRMSSLERKLESAKDENQEIRNLANKEKEKVVFEAREDLERVRHRLQEEWQQLFRQKQAEIEAEKKSALESLAKKIREEITEEVRNKTTLLVREETEARLRLEMPTSEAPDPDVLEARIRKEMESEFLNQLRDKESEMETRLAEMKEETKKEMDKLKWDNESQKEEVKRAREARAHLEKEAQDLIQQAEEHFKRELEKLQAQESEKLKKKTGGFFTGIGLHFGHLLDTPLVDTKRKKGDDEGVS